MLKNFRILKKVVICLNVDFWKEMIFYVYVLCGLDSLNDDEFYK